MRAQVLNSVRADCCLGLLTDIKVTGRRAGNAYYTTWLVVWNMNFIFPYLGNFIIPTDELSIIFQRGWAQPPTSNQSFGDMKISAAIHGSRDISRNDGCDGI